MTFHDYADRFRPQTEPRKTSLHNPYLSVVAVITLIVFIGVGLAAAVGEIYEAGAGPDATENWHGNAASVVPLRQWP